TLDSAAYREALAALGFEPMTTDVKDLVRVVETGTVQAQENPLTNLLSFSLWRHHPHVSLTGHFFGVLLLVCPRAWHETLDATQLRALDAAVTAATNTQRALAQQQDETALTALRAQGVQVLPPQELDMAALRAATIAVSQALRARLPTELVQAYLTPTLH
ncbi:MAG: TRAP transporter substrate-binding protein, partial [Rubrivivax sp.]